MRSGGLLKSHPHTGEGMEEIKITPLASQPAEREHVMTIISEPARQNQNICRESRPPEDAFNQSPWNRITYSDGNHGYITMQIGHVIIKVAISFPELDLEDLDIKVSGNSLMFDITTQGKYFSRRIDLPVMVETNSVRVTGTKGIFTILLQRKQANELNEYVI
jgi:HSP20 family molecular chaperone IbpA